VVFTRWPYLLDKARHLACRLIRTFRVKNNIKQSGLVGTDYLSSRGGKAKAFTIQPHPQPIPNREEERQGT
jgi:hypothetical protein